MIDLSIQDQSAFPKVNIKLVGGSCGAPGSRLEQGWEGWEESRERAFPAGVLTISPPRTPLMPGDSPGMLLLIGPSACAVNFTSGKMPRHLQTDFT